MEMTSTGVVRDSNMSHENDDSVSAGDGSRAEGKAENMGSGTIDEPSDCSMIQSGEIAVPLASLPDESMDKLPHEGHVDPLLTVAERPSESGSKSKFLCRLNQGGKAVGRQRGRKLRGAGPVKAPGAGSSPSQPMKPYEAEQSSEDNENRSSSTKHAKGKTPVSTVVYDDNDPSRTRRQSQRSGDEEQLMGTPARRLVLAPLPPSELNKRMGTTPNQTPERYTPTTKTVTTSATLTPAQVAPTSVEETSPILSLQETASTTVQVLAIGDESSESAEEDTIESALGKLSMLTYGPDDSIEVYDSDKENVPVHEVLLPGNRALKLFNARQPLQTLYSAPSPSLYQSPDVFSTPTASQQLYRARYQVEGGRQWQMTVDTNCLLNTESLESIKRLKGVHETLLVIPNIVIRELDYLQKQEESKAWSTSALQWIETCMYEVPFWIHVQSSVETGHVAMTSPASPSIYSRGLHPHVAESDIMQPTLHDLVLECALLQQATRDGRIVILTDDTTLKIKALAEGLVVDTATSFSNSLFNPYSERFAYSGSTPIGRSSSRLQEKLSDGFNTPPLTTSSSRCPLARPGTLRPTSRANFSIWRRSQPVGLQALLA